MSKFIFGSTNTQMDRNKFLKNALVIGSASALSLNQFTISALVQPKSKKPFQTKKRITLKKAGPMIPPVPAVLLTVKGENDIKDEISVAWTFVVNGKPPQIGISVEDVHVSLGFLKKHKEFVLNVPTAAIIKEFDKVDMNSTKTGDKFAFSRLTRGKATIVEAPTINEAPIQLECKVIKEIDIPPIRTIFIADVVATRVLEGTCDVNGRLIVDAIDFFGMTAGSGEFYTMGEKVGHIGKSVGRSDIKY